MITFFNNEGQPYLVDVDVCATRKKNHPVLLVDAQS